ALRDVTGDLRGADDPSPRILDRRNTEGDIQERSILAHADGLVVLDPFAAADALENLPLLVPAVGRNDERDRLTDHLAGGIAKETLRAGVPGRHDAIEILARDGIRRRLDDRGKSPLAFVEIRIVHCDGGMRRDSGYDLLCLLRKHARIWMTEKQRSMDFGK